MGLLLLLGYLLRQVLPDRSLGTENSQMRAQTPCLAPYEICNLDEVTFPYRHPEQEHKEGRAGSPGHHPLWAKEPLVKVYHSHHAAYEMG